MKPKGLVAALATLIALVFLTMAGTLSTERTVSSFGPPETATPVSVDEQFDAMGPDALAGWRNRKGNSGSKVESALRQLIDENTGSGLQAALDMAGGMSLKTKDDSVLVVVEGVEGAAAKLKSILESRGGSDATTNADLVQAYLPLGAIDEVAALPEVKRVRRPLLPALHYVSEGAGVINAPAWQSAGKNGTGVKIGIIDAGFLNYGSLLGSELPPGERVTVQSFFPGGDITGGGERHGTACAEIIYDIAPGAHFYLANIYSDVDFGNAVDWMIANGVSVVSVSLGWMGANNYDGLGFLDNKVNAARAAGIFWANSSGNQAQEHWEGPFVDNDGDNVHNFTSYDEGQTISAVAGSYIFGALTWNDSWSSPSNDYDLYLVRTTDNAIMAGSVEEQGPGVPPSEAVAWIANQTGSYYFAIVRWSGAPVYFDLYTAYNNLLQYQVPSSSLVAPADATGAIAVGAFYYSTGTIENFSSQGPTNDGRGKPELAGPDGVSTYSYLGSGYGRFYGTSAAAPHVAGAAALVKQTYPWYSPADIQWFLQNRAVDAGTPGFDNVYGSGKLNLGAAPATPTPTPSPTPTPLPSLSLNKSSLSFLADDTYNPSSQTVNISNAGGGTLTWTAQEWSGGAPYDYSWLSLGSAGGTAPSTLQVSVNKAAISPGDSVIGSIRVDGTSPQSQNTPQYVSVYFDYVTTPLAKNYLPVVAKGYVGAW